MASEKPEDPMNNTGGTAEETIAQRLKRLRRVSFADREITSVHIFNRDEDYETPPNSSASKPQNGEQAYTSESEDKVIRFFSDREDTDGDAEDELIVDKSFLRPKCSPSSGGSSTVGSANSDDEDGFFGPVSSHFINPGRLSDVTISEEHHDMTMDSTAFSMHYKSLARSESGDVRTPTSSHLPVEENTPTQATSRSDTGSAMALTKPKKMFPKSPVLVEEGSGGRDSNDMSIVGENSRKYDYGYISPTLAALLVDESKDLAPASLDNTVRERSPIHGFSLISDTLRDSHGVDSSDACGILSPSGSGGHPQIVLQESGSQRYTRDSRRQTGFFVGMLPQTLSCVTPSPKQGGSFMSRETLALVESLSTIQKGKSRLGLIPPSPGSALSQRIEKSRLQLSGYRSVTTPLATGREEFGVRRDKHADIPITNLEDLLSKDDNRTPVPEKKGIADQHSCGALSPVVDISDGNRTPVSERKDIPGALNPAVDISDDNRIPVSEKEGLPDQRSCGALSPAVDISNDSTTVSEKEGLPDQRSCGALISDEDISNDERTPVSEEKVVKDQHSCGAMNPAFDIRDENRTPISEKEGIPDQHSFGALISDEDISNGDRTPVSEEKGITDQHSCGAMNPAFDISNDNRTPVSEKKGITDQHSCGAMNPAFDLSNDNRTPFSEKECIPDQRSCAALSPAVDISNDNTTPVSEKEGLPDQRSCGALNSSVDISNVFASDAKGPSRLKRKAKDADCAVRNCSPKVGKSTQYISNQGLDHADGNFDANDCRLISGQVMNWVDIPGKVSEDIKEILAPLADKLNSKLVCRLEDILTHMKKVHLCEMLCLQIQSKKACDDLSGAKTKRRAESRSLLCKLAYEKAKLELLLLKKEIMMKKFQEVSTGVQTSETLRLNCDNILSQHGLHSTGQFNTDQAHEANASKGAEMTQEIKVLDSKIKNLIQFFPLCDTMTEEPAYADAIMIAKDDLVKRMSRRTIRQDTLVWKIDNLGEWNDCQSIVLNYSGLFNQRVTLKPGHPSCVLVSNSLSDTFIKHFPDLNVSVAFNSLFNVEDSQKYVGGSNMLLEITQKSSLVLNNLVDVAEEFQLARMNIPHLVKGNFDSPSAEQLHLQISFLDCTNSRKLIVILDVSCLIHGKYPNDVVPCELREVSGTIRDSLVSKQLKNEIESAMNDVGVGYPRILRLCRCISKVLQSQR